MLRKLRNLIKIARITLSSKDDGKYSIQQINYMGKTTPCLVVFPYGMHANLPLDCLGTILSCNADEGNLHMFPHLSEERIKGLKPGEVIFFHPKTKSYNHYKNNGDIDVFAKGDYILNCNNYNITAKQNINLNAGQDINAEASNFNITAKLNVNGDTKFTGSVSANDFPIDETHNHGGPETAPDGPVTDTGTVNP